MPQTDFSLTLPSHFSYFLLDENVSVVAFSPGVLPYTQDDEAFDIGSDLRDSFPELFSLEDIFQEIIEGQRQEFAVKAINRPTDTGSIYLDLYCQQGPVNSGESPTLLVFVEDVTDKMSLEQSLVQNNNETNLLISALENARQYADTIIASIAEALIVTDLDGKILRVNAVTVEMLGYSVDELIGRSLFDILQTEEAQLLRYQAIEFFTAQKTQNQRIVVTCQHKQGESIILSFSCSVLEQTPAQKEIIYIVRDVTRDRLEQDRLATQYMIARALSEAESIEQITQNVLNIICSQLQFEVGELWVPVSPSEIDASKFPAIDSYPIATTYLQRLEGVSLEQINEKEGFVDISNRVILFPGRGLAGRVWEQRSPQWIYDLQLDQDFGKQSFACRDGLRSAFAFPVRTDGNIFGIMTFFSLHLQSPNPELLQIMDSTGQQLGQYIRRKQMENALKEQQNQTESLLLNILPETIATELRQSGRTIARQFDQATVLFADLVGFMEFAASLSPIEVVEVLNQVFSQFDGITEKYKLEKIKTIGDSYMVVGGLPEPRTDHVEAIANMALEMQQALASFNQETGNTLRLRIGINSGAVVAGVIGQKKFIYDLWGDTVNIASRMESHGIPDRIQCSRATFEALADMNYEWDPRGEIPIKGKGSMHTYFLEGRG